MNNLNTSEQIKALRRAKGLSQESLAENARINLRTLQRIEAGDTIPRGETLRLLAQALEVPVEHFSATAETSSAPAREDTGVLKLLNLSALSFWILPFGNVFLPFAFWLYKRNTVVGVADFGKRVLQFQAAWTVLAYGIPLISMFSSIFGRLGVPQFPLYFSSALLVINTIVIAWTHFAIDRPGMNIWFKVQKTSEAY
ncbi:helix-turn-helix domain-containing protein [Dyadobacter endophyticus]|uniref:helix-turn-helix domain-containing protein n=1 Tax=Dyadobacter endophyticus TaxID=1749036 RepID=UPI003CEBCECA